MDPLGQVLTFYSYKGGAGRSMGLANVAALLAKWRMKVLVIDWDLEAPGIEVYFKSIQPTLVEQRKTTNGIIDWVKSIEAGHELDWHDCLLSVRPFPDGEDLNIISAGRDDESYMSLVQHTDWGNLFEKKGLGIRIEAFRDAVKKAFDFVLIDSRTGITDIGGICTIHLPDFLVVWFTTNETSVQGVQSVAGRARREQDKLPFDRNKLLVLPVPSRDESRTELEKANQWKAIFADRFGEFYREWLPRGLEPNEVVEKLRIPYVPFWSFEEGLPVAREDTKDPSSISAAYETLSRLIFWNLGWKDIERDPEQSIEYLRRATKVDVLRFGSDLAESLFSQALDFWKADRKDDASENLNEAISIWTKLSAEDLKSYGLKLARARKFLSELLDKDDERSSNSEAMAAIAVYRSIFEIDPGLFGLEVADSLVELSHRLHDKTESEEAIETLMLALQALKRLAQSNPSRFEPALARELYDLSNWEIEKERFVKGLRAIQEAVTIYRRLIDVNKEQFEPALADSLVTLSECWLETGKIQNALETGEEAVKIYKSLSSDSPKRFELGLIKTLNALLDILSRTDITSGAWQKLLT